MFGVGSVLRLLLIALTSAPGYLAAQAQESDGRPGGSARSESHKSEASAEGGLQIIGRRGSLQLMIEDWAGGLADRVSVAEDGTVIFDATRAEVEDDASARLLYDLATHRDRFIFYAGTDADFVANLFTSINKEFDRGVIRKQFAGRGYTTGGRHAVGTRERAHALQPTGGVFAVIAYNTRALMRQVATSDLFPFVEYEEQEAGLGQPISLSSYFIHEAAENLAFAAQLEGRRAMSYEAAHAEAMREEAEIRRQRGSGGGFAGGQVVTTGGADRAAPSYDRRRGQGRLKDLFSFFGSLHRTVTAGRLRNALPGVADAAAGKRTATPALTYR